MTPSKLLADTATQLNSALQAQTATSGVEVVPNKGYIKNIERSTAVTLGYGGLAYGGAGAFSEPSLSMTGWLDATCSHPNKDDDPYGVAYDLAATVSSWLRERFIYQLTDDGSLARFNRDGTPNQVNGEKYNLLGSYRKPMIMSGGPRYLRGALSNAQIDPNAYTFLVVRAELEAVFKEPFDISDPHLFSDLSQITFNVNGTTSTFNYSTGVWS